jgi:hypothetical protein
MSEAVASVAAQIAAPVVSALLEDLHRGFSSDVGHLEATMPAELKAADQRVQDWARALLGALHGGIARIEGARANVTAATTPGPTGAETATSTGTSAPTTATSTTTQATTPADATTKASA